MTFSHYVNINVLRDGSWHRGCGRLYGKTITALIRKKRKGMVDDIGKIHFRRMDEGTDADFAVLARMHEENPRRARRAEHAASF